MQRLLISTLIALQSSLFPLLSHAQSPTSFWSQRPAGRWEESLVTGNGIMGAMVEGNPYREHVVLNHSLLFLPINPIMMPPSQGKHLDEIRQMMLGGRFEEASQLLVDIATEEGYVGKHNSDLFVPACRLAISTDSVSPTRNYRRSVDFRTGVCRKLPHPSCSMPCLAKARRLPHYIREWTPRGMQRGKSAPALVIFHRPALFQVPPGRPSGFHCAAWQR